MKKIILISFFLFARTASAQVVISEIMYDPQGSDAGHEWVEVVNQGSSPVDLSKSKFVEGGSSHGLTSVQGAAELLSGAYAVIADNARTFLNDHAGFSGTVLDSSFSLKNTGETISFKTPDGNISETVSYTSDMGASSDGNSLQKINGTWKSAAPTPGAENIFVQNPTQTSSSNINTTNTSSGETSSPTLKIAAEAGMQVRVVLAGQPVVFEGNVSGLESSPGATRTTWSFGDGASGEGASVSHTYYYPGEYTAIIEVSSGSLVATDRMLVRVVSPNISLRTGGDESRSFVSIENQGSDELDLAGWQIVSAEKKFIFPKNTILSAHKTVTFASEVTGLMTPAGTVPELRFSNGSRVDIKAEAKTVSVVPQAFVSKATTAHQVPALRTHAQGPALVSDQKPIQVLQNQQASAANALSDTQAFIPIQKEGSVWPWYIGSAFLGALALLGIRITQNSEEKVSTTAEDFEIIEETDDEEPY